MLGGQAMAENDSQHRPESFIGLVAGATRFQDGPWIGKADYCISHFFVEYFVAQLFQPFHAAAWAINTWPGARKSKP